jgi:hypothetical protein
MRALFFASIVRCPHGERSRRPSADNSPARRLGKKNGFGWAFSGCLKAWHDPCDLRHESDISQHPRRTIMKFETLMLPSLFAVCSLVCVLTFGAMLI